MSGVGSGRGAGGLNRLQALSHTVGVNRPGIPETDKLPGPGSDPGSGPLAELVERGEVPRDWYKWSQAAYLLGLGWTARDASKAAGVAERTLFNWRQDSRWRVFERQAGELWLSDVYQAARLRVLRALAQDTLESLKLSERILSGELPGLAPSTNGDGARLPGGVNVGVVVGLPTADQGSRGEAIMDQARVLELGEIPDDER